MKRTDVPEDKERINRELSLDNLREHLQSENAYEMEVSLISKMERNV